MVKEAWNDHETAGKQTDIDLWLVQIFWQSVPCPKIHIYKSFLACVFLTKNKFKIVTKAMEKIERIVVNVKHTVLVY